jgi:hypothetical protein
VWKLALEPTWRLKVVQILSTTGSEWTVDPNNPLAVDCDGDFVRQSWAVEFLRPPLPAWILSWFLDTEIHSIDGCDGDFFILVKINPNNLQQAGGNVRRIDTDSHLVSFLSANSPFGL